MICLPGMDHDPLIDDLVFYLDPLIMHPVAEDFKRVVTKTPYNLQHFYNPLLVVFNNF